MITPKQAKSKRAAQAFAETMAVLDNAGKYVDPFLERGEYRIDIPRDLRPHIEQIAAHYRKHWDVKVSGTYLVFSEPPAEGNDRS
jgi:hypothetical protein